MSADYPFYVSPRNRKGVFLFFFICLTVIFLPRIIRSIDKPLVISISKSKIAEFEQRRKEYYKKKSYFKRKRSYSLPPLRFDPNKYEKADWLKLGLSEKQVNVVMKFTQKGLYSNEDLKKIFVIPAQLFTLIKDSTFYPDKPTIKKIVEEKKVAVPYVINLNTATESELLAIKGLGAYYAKAILKYKGELGGFVRKSQLMEIFKMSSESYEKIIPHIQINPTEIRLLEINDATLEEFNAHPYLSWSQANSIFKMRIQKNGFHSLNELKESRLIDEETYDKLLPYLTL
jgi:DNA uptake protein ComE-like DNA-binding protein